MNEKKLLDCHPVYPKMTPEQLTDAIMSGTVPDDPVELVSPPTTRYTIAPLAWVPARTAGEPLGEWWIADTIFGEVWVRTHEDGTIHWSAWIGNDGEGPDGNGPCSSIADGKRQAEEWYVAKLLPALQRVEG